MRRCSFKPELRRVKNRDESRSKWVDVGFSPELGACQPWASGTGGALGGMSAVHHWSRLAGSRSEDSSRAIEQNVPKTVIEGFPVSSK